MPLPESQAVLLVVSQLGRLVRPSLLTAALLLLLRRYTAVHPPTWAVPGLALAVLPVYYAVRIRFASWHIQRRAARLGAALPPRLEGRKFGNWDILQSLTESFETDYLSETLFGYMHTIGHSFELYILWDRAYVTDDANVVKAMLATDFNTWVKGDRFDGCVRSVLGTGVFNSDGDMWKFHRSMTRPFFTRERISHFELFNRHADDAMSKMRARLAAGYAVDFQDLVSRFTLDSATEFLFDACVHSLANVLPYPHDAPAALRANVSRAASEDFARAFAAAQEAVNFRVRMGNIWPYFELLGSKTQAHMRVVDAFLDPILKAAVEKARVEKTMPSQQSKEEIGEDETLLDHLVKYTSDPTVLHDEVLNIMIAGRDTTAGTLTMAVYFLSQHPDVLRRLREEILSKVGPERRPTYNDIREMKFLRAFINETLRLLPAVPWNVRYPVKDTLIPSSDPEKPWFIPARASVSYSVHCMHRRKDYWGPDADAFDPDRFLDARLHTYLTPNPFIFLPFNAGPRICLGQQFAYNEMSFFLVRLLQAFDAVALAPAAHPPADRVPPAWRGAPGRKGVERMWPKAHLTLYSKGGLWVRMTEAQNA
ncbi:hypothetical protein PHLGIDRAFT_100824 [Phlebiopsis gigantea 11061_1 CR5-6]|uniref:Cytochrome P450 monooxygenase pc-3 n=1 Tax=Phlebiopsis gigantea (strain 11061_1 CR5-6) TaxID=745531 RepID=A0A0C3SC86_PHLG1|nr:hypothetical protein PHLGIDRAFT_100824 [Phlebiopsis gigantea 11061_1 CR5-6]